MSTKYLDALFAFGVNTVINNWKKTTCVMFHLSLQLITDVQRINILHFDNTNAKHNE